jgi:hypothetical protein
VAPSMLTTTLATAPAADLADPSQRRVVSASIPDVKHIFTALPERHGLDRDTVAAMAFERSRQQKISLTQALDDLVAELDQQAGEAR